MDPEISGYVRQLEAERTYWGQEFADIHNDLDTVKENVKELQLADQKMQDKLEGFHNEYNEASIFSYQA